MFDSLTKYVQHFRWISICFMIAKNVCLRYICIFPFACCFFIYFSFSVSFFRVQKPLFFRTDSTLQYALFKFEMFNIYKYFEQIKETRKQVIPNTDSSVHGENFLAEVKS